MHTLESSGIILHPNIVFMYVCITMSVPAVSLSFWFTRPGPYIMHSEPRLPFDTAIRNMKKKGQKSLLKTTVKYVGVMLQSMKTGIKSNRPRTGQRRLLGPTNWYFPTIERPTKSPTLNVRKQYTWDSEEKKKSWKVRIKSGRSPNLNKRTKKTWRQILAAGLLPEAITTLNCRTRTLPLRFHTFVQTRLQRELNK